jgi:hypothetical protein
VQNLYIHLKLQNCRDNATTGQNVFLRRRGRGRRIIIAELPLRRGGRLLLLGAVVSQRGFFRAPFGDVFKGVTA